MSMFKQDLFPQQKKDTLFTSNDLQVKKIENQIEMLPSNTLRVNNTHTNSLEESRIKDLVESISNVGILTPLIVRINPKEKGTYEILSGGHRFEASKRLYIKDIPCIIKNVDDDTANIYWFDTNLQRNFDTMPKSEIALGIKLKVEAEKRQGKRTDLIELEELDNSNEQTEKPFNMSDRNISRYLRIAELIPEFLKKLDNNIIGIRVAETLGYIKQDKQVLINNIMDENSFNIDTKKALLLKSSKDKLNEELIYKILSDEYEEKLKKKRKPRTKIVRLEISDLQGLIPEAVLSDPENDIKEYVLKILKQATNTDKN